MGLGISKLSYVRQYYLSILKLIGISKRFFLQETTIVSDLKQVWDQFNNQNREKIDIEKL